jgi:hypothetical protein
MFGAEFEAVLEDGHHAEAEEVDLHEAEVFAVVFVPLDDGATFHRGGFEWDNFVEVSGTEDHAAGVLAEVAREAFDAIAEGEEGGKARVGGGDAGEV